MPLYWNDFLSDNKVRVMSSGELGAYVRLLGAAWHEAVPGTLPADDHLLARLAGVTAGVWRRIAQRVLACFALNEKAGRWEQKRMTQEYVALANRNERRSDSASKAAAARWSRGLQANGHASAQSTDADALRPHCLSESESESDSDSPSDTDPSLARGVRSSRMGVSGSEPVPAQVDVPPANGNGFDKSSARHNPESAMGIPQSDRSQSDSLLTEMDALNVAANSGIAPEFAKMVHGDWFARGGRDGAGVAVPWLRYVAKRWAREGPEWQAGAHRSQTTFHASAANPASGNPRKPQRLSEADRDRARTGIESTAGQALKRL